MGICETTKEEEKKERQQKTDNNFTHNKLKSSPLHVNTNKDIKNKNQRTIKEKNQNNNGSNIQLHKKDEKEEDFHNPKATKQTATQSFDKKNLSSNRNNVENQRKDISTTFQNEPTHTNSPERSYSNHRNDRITSQECIESTNNNTNISVNHQPGKSSNIDNDEKNVILAKSNAPELLIANSIPEEVLNSPENQTLIYKKQEQYLEVEGH